MVRVLRMFSRGFALSTTKSARLPFESVPVSLIRHTSVGLEVDAMINVRRTHPIPSVHRDFMMLCEAVRVLGRNARIGGKHQASTGFDGPSTFEQIQPWSTSRGQPVREQIPRNWSGAAPPAVIRCSISKVPGYAGLSERIIVLQYGVFVLPNDAPGMAATRPPRVCAYARRRSSSSLQRCGPPVFSTDSRDSSHSCVSDASASETPF